MTDGAIMNMDTKIKKKVIKKKKEYGKKKPTTNKKPNPIDHPVNASVQIENFLRNASMCFL